LTWSNFAACFRGSVKERDMNVFIIGATGYIGRAATARVLNAGHRVTALVRAGAASDGLGARRRDSAHLRLPQLH
jgi:nucleoside-diphosphate-sugar epimerase